MSRNNTNQSKNQWNIQENKTKKSMNLRTYSLRKQAELSDLSFNQSKES